MLKKGHQLLGGEEMEGTREKHGGDVEKDVAGNKAEGMLLAGSAPCQRRYGSPPTLRGLWSWQNVPGQEHP